eukprot:scaffold5402_cov285-Chaetoceros_neogracile.AAC.2
MHTTACRDSGRSCFIEPVFGKQDVKLAFWSTYQGHIYFGISRQWDIHQAQQSFEKRTKALIIELDGMFYAKHNTQIKEASRNAFTCIPASFTA